MINYLRSALLACAALLGAHYVHAQTLGSGNPMFFNSTPQVNPNGLSPQVGTYSYFDYADMDSDGDMDIIRFPQALSMSEPDVLLNDGTNNFSSTGPAPYGLSLNAALSSYSATYMPALGDMDGDADLDLLLTPANGGVSTFFCENVGTPSAPSFAAPVNSPFGLGLWAISSIDLVDLDGDGLLDIVGATAGYGGHQWLVFHNLGTSTTPFYSTPEYASYGLSIDWNYDDYSYPQFPNFLDYDSDGDYDLVYNNSYWVVYEENVGTATSPSFSTPIMQFGYSNLGSTRLVNWDSDPDLEMLFMYYNGDFHLLDVPILAITSQPTDLTVCDGTYTNFTLQATGVISYNWQIYDPYSGWIAAPSDWYHSGNYSNSFYFNPAYLGTDNGDMYRCVLTGVDNTQLISDTVTITVNSYQAWYADADGDGLGNSSTYQTSCFSPGAGYVNNGSDCDDTDPTPMLPPGDPNVFPQDQWNVYGFDGYNLDYYRGYYSFTGMSYNTGVDFDASLSPSSAPGWSGCAVAVDNNSFSIKRRGFPATTNAYRIILQSWDDDVYVYVNGSYVTSTGCCASAANMTAWTGMLDANSTVEFKCTEYGGLEFLSFSIVEVAPLNLISNSSNFMAGDACSPLGFPVTVESMLGYSTSDITFSAISENTSIITNNIDYVDDWWGNLTVYVYMGGSAGVTNFQLVATDPAGNSDTLDYQVEGYACAPILLSTSSSLSCGAVSDTLSFQIFNANAAVDYTINSLWSINQYAITDSDLQLISTLPVDSVFPNGITYYGTEYLVSYTYSGYDTWSSIVLDLQSVQSGTTYEMVSSVGRSIDYSTPVLYATFPSVEVAADPVTCDAVVNWNVVEQIPSSYFGAGSDYVTNFTNSGIFYVAANGYGVTRFGLTGNAGADGSGVINYGSTNYTAPSGRSYIIFYEMGQEIYGDPGINNILIVEGSETGAYLTYDAAMSNTTAVLENLSGSSHIFFAATLGSAPASWVGNSTYSVSTMVSVGQRFADALDATRTASAGNPMNLSLINSSMEVETAYMSSVMLPNFYAITTDYYTNWLGQAIGIGDGGYDMYDGGNFIVTNYNNFYNFSDTGIPYTYGAVTLGGPPSSSSYTLVAYDDCAFDLTYSVPSGTAFPVGTTTVTVTATDGSGNTNTINFDVVVTGSTVSYYADADLDGYGAGSLLQFCQEPGAGYVSNNADCDDTDAAIYPNATEVCDNADQDCDGTADDGLVFIDYFVDTDNDGYGAGAAFNACANPGAGYVLTSNDCNNNNAAAHPGATEVCGNSVDEDCNGIADNGCFLSAAGENPSNAISATTSLWPNCSSISGTLVGASSSSAAQSICLTGEDKWYQFVATTEAASIAVNSSSNDIVVELQTASGTLIATENSFNGLGGEIMTISGLTAGQLYKLGIRNYNSAAGIGTFSVCVRMLKRGGCDYGAGPYSLCQYFKATWAGASGTSYRYTFTGLTGPAAGNVYTRTQSTDICVLSNVTPTLPYGSTYNLLVTNIFTVNNAAGDPVVVEVPALAPCTVHTIAEPSTALRAADQCTNGPKFRGSIVAAAPWVCGVNNWRWKFTEVNPTTYATVGIPFEVNRAAASNYLNLGTVTQLQYGKTYAVQSAPVLSYTATNYNWGPVTYLCIVGTAGVTQDPGTQPNQRLVENDAPNLLVYPNPNDGNFVLNLSGIQTSHAEIRIHDAMGRQVFRKSVAVDGTFSSNVNLADLSNGLYMVEVVYNGQTMTQRVMIQK